MKYLIVKLYINRKFFENIRKFAVNKLLKIWDFYYVFIIY